MSKIKLFVARLPMCPMLHLSHRQNAFKLTFSCVVCNNRSLNISRSTLLCISSDIVKICFCSGLELLPSTRGFWVGATDIVSEGSFVWSDRTPLSKDFPYWNNNQPDDFKGNEDCVEVISVNNVIMLNDFQCLAKLGFVCQVDIRM